jgi:hypothetical protein
MVGQPGPSGGAGIAVLVCGVVIRLGFGHRVLGALFVVWQQETRPNLFVSAHRH